MINNLLKENGLFDQIHALSLITRTQLEHEEQEGGNIKPNCHKKS